MTIKSNYKTEDMFREYMYGESSMAEIVQKTGINRKTWNQRFSRLQRKQREFNGNDSAGEAKFNGDKSEMQVAKATINKASNGTNKFISLLGAIVVVAAIYFLYVEIKRRNEKVSHDSNMESAS